jgi:hypothetical protein
MTAKSYGTKIIIALFLVLTNTDRALPPSIAFSAMMVDDDRFLKVLVWTFACSRLKNERCSCCRYDKPWFHYGRMIYVVIVVTNKLDRNGYATAFHDSMSVLNKLTNVLGSF